MGFTCLVGLVFVTLLTVWFWPRRSFERSRVSLVAEKCFCLILVSQTERMYPCSGFLWSIPEFNVSVSFWPISPFQPAFPFALYAMPGKWQTVKPLIWEMPLLHLRAALSTPQQTMLLTITDFAPCVLILQLKKPFFPPQCYCKSLPESPWFSLPCAC